MATESPRTVRWSRGHDRFNGAVASWRRKDTLRKGGAGQSNGLQWGRRLLATESSQTADVRGVRNRPLQWGRRLLATERRKFMLSAPREVMLQWGRRLLATERLSTASPGSCRGLCFNGAVASWRRKGPRERNEASHYRASMGPSPLGDGKARSTDRCAWPARSFNGAVASWRRKDVGGSPAPVTDEQLQWGRRLLATERVRRVKA